MARAKTSVRTAGTQYASAFDNERMSIATHELLAAPPFSPMAQTLSRCRVDAARYSRAMRDVAA